MTFPSLQAFYAGDRRRRTSRERDVGLFWRGRGGATYRAAWVQATGEFYLLRHGRPDCQGGPVRLLGSYSSREVEEAFAGWRDVCGRPRSVEWLLARTSGIEGGGIEARAARVVSLLPYRGQTDHSADLAADPPHPYPAAVDVQTSSAN